MQDYKKLEIWNDSHLLALEIYGITKNFHKDETYGVISQIRRAAVSIPTNIAEGCGRKFDKEFLQFLSISYGSTNEVDYLLLLSKDLKYITQKKFEEIQNKVEFLRKRISKFMSKVKENLK